VHNAFDPAIQFRFQSGAEHLHCLGPRATAEFLVEIAGPKDAIPAIMDLLAEYEWRLTPAMLGATGGDHFPPRLLDAAPCTECAQ
jgi:hypothetical protein